MEKIDTTPLMVGFYWSDPENEELFKPKNFCLSTSLSEGINSQNMKGIS